MRNRPRIIGAPNALQKLAHVDPRAVKQQGTTRTLFHYLTYSTDRNYEFFINLNNTNAIFKNIEQNKLTEGEALVVKRLFFPMLIVDPADNEIVQGTFNWRTIGLENLLSARIDIVIGNQTVVKDLPITKALAYNKELPSFFEQMCIDLESEIVLEKDVEFKVVLKNCGKILAVPANYKVGIALDGYGKILNMKKNI